MRRVSILLSALTIGAALPLFDDEAFAFTCAGSRATQPRTITYDMREFPRVGAMQYPRSLPLNDRELVLTFDDGPLPPYTQSVLDTLARECVPAVFFLVGRQANAHPDIVRQIYNAGHTIGTHSQNHPLTFNQMAPDFAEREINDGISSVTTALGDPRALAPFFRIPGFLRAKPVEDMLASRNIAVWSTDFDADDWKQITVQELMQRALDRIEKRKRGILLLHDVQPSTAMALPGLIQELRKRGYRFVHVVHDGVKPRSLPPTGLPPGKPSWPRVSGAGSDIPAAFPEETTAGTRRDARQERREERREVRPDRGYDRSFERRSEPQWDRNHREIIIVR